MLCLLVHSHIAPALDPSCPLLECLLHPPSAPRRAAIPTGGSTGSFNTAIQARLPAGLTVTPISDLIGAPQGQPPPGPGAVPAEEPAAPAGTQPVEVGALKEALTPTAEALRLSADWPSVSPAAEEVEQPPVVTEQGAPPPAAEAAAETSDQDLAPAAEHAAVAQAVAPSLLAAIEARLEGSKQGKPAAKQQAPQAAPAAEAPAVEAQLPAPAAEAAGGAPAAAAPTPQPPPPLPAEAVAAGSSGDGSTSMVGIAAGAGGGAVALLLIAGFTWFKLAGRRKRRAAAVAAGGSTKPGSAPLPVMGGAGHGGDGSLQRKHMQQLGVHAPQLQAVQQVPPAGYNEAYYVGTNQVSLRS